MPTEQTKILKARMRRFGTNVILLTPELGESTAKRIVEDQIIRSSCSVGANYRAAQRARSTADMIAKLKIVEEELDESIFWMEVMVESNIATKELLLSHYKEANELISIVVSAIKSLRAKKSVVRESFAPYGTDISDIFDEP